MISGDEETDGIELIIHWNVLENLRLTGMTTYRENEGISEEYFNAAGEPAGGVNESDETTTEYTLRLDWTPRIPVGFMLVHVDYIYKEDPGPKNDEAIF